MFRRKRNRDTGKNTDTKKACGCTDATLAAQCSPPLMNLKLTPMKNGIKEMTMAAILKFQAILFG